MSGKSTLEENGTFLTLSWWFTLGTVTQFLLKGFREFFWSRISIWMSSFALPSFIFPAFLSVPQLALILKWTFLFALNALPCSPTSPNLLIPRLTLPYLTLPYLPIYLVQFYMQFPSRFKALRWMNCVAMTTTLPFFNKMQTHSQNARTHLFIIKEIWWLMLPNIKKTQRLGRNWW